MPMAFGIYMVHIFKIYFTNGVNINSSLHMLFVYTYQLYTCIMWKCVHVKLKYDSISILVKL